MLDLTSLLIVAGIFLGIVVGDAAVFGDTMQVQITIPQKLVQAGYTEAAAEQVFAAEVARIGQVRSPLAAPTVHMSSRPTVLAAVAKPLNLDGVVVAVQDQVGIDIVAVNGAVMSASAGNGLDLFIVVSPPHHTPVRMKLTQPDGDVDALIERATRLVLEQVMPFRCVLADMTEGLNGNAALLTRAKETATRAVGEPWSPGRATDLVLLRDELAILALVDGNIAEAKAQFNESDAVPQAIPASHGLVALNRAFVAVAEKRPAEAQAYLDAGRAVAAAVKAPLPELRSRLATISALVAWSNGNTAQAEQLLRVAIGAAADDEAPHVYLARLLEAKGDAAGAAQQRTEAAWIHRPDIELAPLAQSVFWVDPVNGGLRRRN